MAVLAGRNVNVLGVIIARGGSKGLPNKHLLPLLDKPVVAYSVEAALDTTLVDRVILTSDDPRIRQVAETYPIWVIDRPADLAADTATVDSACRYACDQAERLHGFRADVIVLLYGNIPIRPPGLIDMAVEHLVCQGGDSVQSYTPVGKWHPDWMVRLDGDRVILNCSKPIYRRQDLVPMFMPNGAVLAITRESLYRRPEYEGDFHAFLGKDRRGFVHPDCDLIVDIDCRRDLLLAEAILKTMQPQEAVNEPSLVVV